MKVAVIGGGASGMMAAYAAAENGHHVVLFEKNHKLGKKLIITGKGRCNLTNDSDNREIMQNTVSNPKFLFSALNNFSVADTKDFFESRGIPLKTERGKRVFPLSDKSSDIIAALEKALKSVGVNIRLNTNITDISTDNNSFTLVSNKTKETFDEVIIATGGLSYSATGSTGDGYVFAQKLSHSIITPIAGLSALKTGTINKKPLEKLPQLEGLSLKNVSLSAIADKKIFEQIGEMLFTANGISGPLVLTLSSYINRLDMSKIELFLDLKPALTTDELDARILRDFSEQKNRQFRNSLDMLLPKKMIPLIIELSDIDPYKPVHAITKEERNRLTQLLKGLQFGKIKSEDLDYAIITAGGVNISEINPKTMESKLVKGLFFAGELIDIDALTGGFNLQIAFSTGWTAGKSV